MCYHKSMKNTYRYEILGIQSSSITSPIQFEIVPGTYVYKKSKKKTQTLIKDLEGDFFIQKSFIRDHVKSIIFNNKKGKNENKEITEKTI